MFVKKKTDEQLKIESQILHLRQVSSQQQYVWVPKAISVASMYPYYDMYAEILRDLFERFRFNRKLNTMQTSLFAQQVFNVVFQKCTQLYTTFFLQF